MEEGPKYQPPKEQKMIVFTKKNKAKRKDATTTSS